jgi:hypothetical protein
MSAAKSCSLGIQELNLSFFFKQLIQVPLPLLAPGTS